VDSALSGRNEAVSSSVMSWSFEPSGIIATKATIQRTSTTHLVRRPATNEARALTSGAS
jgi:hypothetical protein